MGAERIFGFDIGTTSIGWTVIDHDVEAASGAILGMGVRIFPEARDAKGTPLNQTRRAKRMARRQLRRRKQRRRELNETLTAAALLPAYGSREWDRTMREDPWSLRRRGLTEALTPHEVGRALYHLAKHRHFRGRELEEGAAEQSTEEAKQADQRASLLDTLKVTGETLGAHLASRGAGQRKRGEHASRDAVRAEFKKLWTAQAAHIEALDEPGLRDEIEHTIFFQRPVFWRKSTLGECPLVPGADLCPKGSWLSHQRRMLEKLNNLEIAGGNQRPLDPDERAAILTKLQTQAAMTWPGVRTALAPIFAARGDKGGQARLKFNLEVGGDSKLPGNPLEAKLASIFGASWPTAHADVVRASIHEKLWACDYGAVGSQRIVILPSEERAKRRAALADDFAAWFRMAPEKAESLAALTLSSGWEPYSTKALERVLPELERGTRFGALIVSPDYEEWRDANFPERARPTGEVRDRLPSPQEKEEQVRLSKLRNPTVVRTQNELRKVVNNLIGAFGKPDRVRIELAREVGLSKREREEMTSGIRKNEKRREDARKRLEECGISQPSKRDIDKWLLWKECQEECPYTGEKIGFDALFGPANRFDIEHIWPRRLSFDDSQRNKTLCLKDIRGDAGQDGDSNFRWVVARKPVDAITRSALEDDNAIVDPHVRDTLRAWIQENGGDPKKAFATFPKVSSTGPPIKKVRLRERRRVELMAKVANGYADAGANHHVAIWRGLDGKVFSECVSLLEASKRIARHEPYVQRATPLGSFLMSLAPGDTIRIPDGERRGDWIVQGVWAAGPIIIWRATDATGSSVFRPTAGSLLSAGARKIAVDPIGRVRIAND